MNGYSVIRRSAQTIMHAMRWRDPNTSGSMIQFAIAGAGVPWLGLVAAAIGWRWSGATTRGAAWNQAWLYANILLAALVFLCWPVLVQRLEKAKIRRNRGDMAARWLVLLMPAMPILIIAGWMNQVSAVAGLRMLAVQLALALFALGISLWQIELGERKGILVAGASAVWFLLPPGIMLIQGSMYPWLTGGLWNTWMAIFPVFMIHSVCKKGVIHVQWFYWEVLLYAAIGAVLVYRAKGGTEH
jgi:hypothetical protein